MKVLADLHHQGLYYSLHKLFEDRLGYELFRPIGLEWFDNGFWDIAKPYGNNRDTAKQYLDLRDHKPADGTPRLNIIEGIKPTHYETYDTYHEYTQKAMTWEQFINTDIDIIIASIPSHFVTYTKMRDVVKPKAKVVCQIGNMFHELDQLVRDGYVKNLLASTIEIKLPKKINSVFYHQEQPPFKYSEPDNKRITSFVHYMPRRDLYDQYKRALPEIDFKSYGSGSPEGWASSIYDLYGRAKDSSMIWQVKPQGDGYGWNWHTAFVVGRPIITNLSDYKDKLGGILFEDLKTGVNLEARSFDENVKLIRNIVSDKERLNNMCENAYKMFRNMIDYDKETQKIKTFLENLV